MGEVVQLPKRNIQHEKTDDLIRMWKEWEDCAEEDDGHRYHYEQIYLELNRRGEGKHCAV